MIRSSGALRPLGVHRIPRPGDNSGIDGRSREQKKADLVDYDKHLARRQELMQDFSESYWKDFHELRRNKGKLWHAPTRLFRQEAALYMPNFHGRTLLPDGKTEDTTTRIRGHAATIVSLFSARFSQEHCESYTKAMGLDARQVNVHMEENPLKAMLTRLFLGSIRRATLPQLHDSYFLITNRFDRQFKEAIGLMNSYTGFVYLVDGECKIRWAACGPADAPEISSLAKGYEKLSPSAHKGVLQTPTDTSPKHEPTESKTT